MLNAEIFESHNPKDFGSKTSEVPKHDSQLRLMSPMAEEGEPQF